jgi:hypothetical protein
MTLNPQNNPLPGKKTHPFFFKTLAVSDSNACSQYVFSFLPCCYFLALTIFFPRSVAADCNRSAGEGWRAGGRAGWLPSGQRSSVSSERCGTIASFRPTIIIVLIGHRARWPQTKLSTAFVIVLLRPPQKEDQFSILFYFV